MHGPAQRVTPPVLVVLLPFFFVAIVVLAEQPQHLGMQAVPAAQSGRGLGEERAGAPSRGAGRHVLKHSFGSSRVAAGSTKRTMGETARARPFRPVVDDEKDSRPFERKKAEKTRCDNEEERRLAVSFAAGKPA